MKTENITSTKKIYIDKCPFCDKEFKGHTENQINYMKKQHILSKHPNKIKIQEE